MSFSFSCSCVSEFMCFFCLIMSPLKLLIGTTTTITTTRTVALAAVILLLAVNCVAGTGDAVVAVDNVANNNSTSATKSNSSNDCNSGVDTSTAAVAAAVAASDKSAAALLPEVAMWQNVSDAAAAGRKLRRGKRYLDFLKGSRMSWRATVKNNILQVNTLWAYGFGLRANFPFPDKADRRRPFFKRDVLQALAQVMDGHGLDGRACILKSYCTAMLDVESHIGGGMLFKLLKMIFNLDAHDRRHLPYLRVANCHQILHSHCPLSFNSISPYTDDN